MCKRGLVHRLALLGLTLCPLFGQFRSTVPLVIAPTTVTDGRGHFVDGLTAKQLTLYDNNVPQAIQVDTAIDPISLVVLIEASSSSEAMLDKLGRSATLFSDMLAGEAGETAIVSFSDSVRVMQDFTSDSSRLSRVLKPLLVQGNGCALLDGIRDALHMLAARNPARRRVLLVIGERRDRSSKLQLPALLQESQLQNTVIYWLTYSTLLTPFTAKPVRKWDRMTDEEKQSPARMQEGRIKYPWPEEEERVPPSTPPGSLFNVFTELAHRTSVDAAAMLSYTTGGRTFSFVKQQGLEDAIHAVADAVHRQYTVAFQPRMDAPGLFHALRVEVKGRPELEVRTRAGYWSIR